MTYFSFQNFEFSNIICDFLTRLSQLVPNRNLAKKISKFYGFFSDLPELVGTACTFLASLLWCYCCTENYTCKSKNYTWISQNYIWNSQNYSEGIAQCCHQFFFSWFYWFHLVRWPTMWPLGTIVTTLIILPWRYRTLCLKSDSATGCATSKESTFWFSVSIWDTDKLTDLVDLEHSFLTRQLHSIWKSSKLSHFKCFLLQIEEVKRGCVKMNRRSCVFVYKQKPCATFALHATF